MFSVACLLGTIQASYPKNISGHTTFVEAPWKVRGSPTCCTGSIPIPLLPKSFLHSYGKAPNKLLLMRPHAAAKSQLHSFWKSLLSLWTRVASKSQLVFHDNLRENVTAFLKTCHLSWNHLSQSHIHNPCCSCNLLLYPRERSQPEKEHMRRNCCRILRRPLAEANPEIQPKKPSRTQPRKAEAKRTTSATRGRCAEGLRGRHSFCNRS